MQVTLKHAEMAATVLLTFQKKFTTNLLTL